MNKASSSSTTSSDMFKSIEIDDMNDNNDTLLRYTDQYDIISIVNETKLRNYLNHHYISVVMICMILITLILINWITIDTNMCNFYHDQNNTINDVEVTKHKQYI